MIVLAIDTSCDETSVAVTDGRQVLSNVISSQVRYHKKWGGVVPFLAQRLHKERIDAVVELALRRADLTWKEIQAIAVTQGPGLAPALEVGIQKAKDLATTYSLPLYAVNHMAGHIASCFAEVGSRKSHIDYPALALLVSGKHTDLVLMEKPGRYQLIGQTVDDAIGEAYDKVARMLGLGYPGGKIVAKLAKQGNPLAYQLPVPMQKSADLNFSYSGLKTAVRMLLEKIQPLDKEKIADVCASFQVVAIESVAIKLKKALKMYPEVRSVLIGGGVAANVELRKVVRRISSENQVAFHSPSNPKLYTDNAAMIGVTASIGIENGQQKIELEDLDRKPSLRL